VPPGKNIVVDLAGVTDVTGTFKTTTYMRDLSWYEVTTRNFAARITEVAVKVTDNDGRVLYEGEWHAEARVSSGDASVVR